MKKEIFPKLGVLTADQLKKLTSGAWKKGWANWGRDHPDPEVQRASAAVMSHSDEIAQSHYLVTMPDKAANWTKQVLKNKGMEQAIDVSIYKICDLSYLCSLTFAYYKSWS